ncbi:hypothetical protein ZIOFF_028149 [Zingiber officinale]|uniref:Uncharacterized protein n=1 Tax=Zingiber officinale TaxID=94328 RepID=A0A8J5GMF9_ZINOF|nr:hypothetical protein ZIOFF_028149 [Zingiber officinale]
MGDNVCGWSWKECSCLRLGVVTDCKGEHFFLIFFSLIIILQYAPASTTTAGTSCSTCFGRTRAVYYSNSEHQGTESDSSAPSTFEV